MPWQDVALLYLDLELSADATEQWSLADENAARLFDVMSYWLNVEYVKWTTDPDEARKAAERGTQTPQPPFPIIEPVAYRPPAAHAAAVALYEEQLEQWQTSQPRSPDAPDDDPWASFARSPNLRTFPKGGE